VEMIYLDLQEVSYLRTNNLFQIIRC